jgi:hypothetical protein
MKKLIIAMMLFLLPAISFSGTYRIRPPGACPNNGDGTTWNCAASADAAGAMVGAITSWDRGTTGSTYYLAGGEWDFGSTAWTLSAAGGSSTKIITLKNATVADNGSDTGWQASYANQVQMHAEGSVNRRAINVGSYFTLDGRLPSTPDDWTYTRGIRVYTTNTSEIQEQLASVSANGIVQGVRFINRDPNTSPNSIRMALFAASDSVVRYNRFTNCSKCVAIYSGTYGAKSNILIEHNYFADVPQVSGGTHADIIDLFAGPDDIYIRYNYFKSLATGPVDHCSPSTQACDTCTVDNIQIYGNIFYDVNDAIATESSNSPCTATGWLIYNNTFIIRADIGKGYQTTNDCSGWKEKNNLYYNITDAQRTTSCYDNILIDVDYNFFNDTISNIEDSGSNSVIDDSDPPSELFADYGEQDFTPTALADYLNIGVDIGGSNPGFSGDMLGTLRGPGSSWDIGAFEFGGEGSTESGPSGTWTGRGMTIQ